MAARKRKRIANQKKNKFNAQRVIKPVLKMALFPVIIFLIIIASFFFLRNVIVNSDYFNIKNVVIVNPAVYGQLRTEEVLNLVNGKSIFRFDTRMIARQLKRNHPEFKNIIIKRILPDTIEAEIVPRGPIALIEAGDYYMIDKKGIVISKEDSTVSGMPIVTGIYFWHRPKEGKAITSDKLDYVFDIIAVFGSNEKLKKFSIFKIDVSNKKDPSIYLEFGLEIKTGPDDLTEKISKLAVVLNDKKVNLDNLRYIDLRFKDPVLGPK